MKLINVFLLVTFFFFTWGQLGRISLPDQPVFGYIYEFFMATSLIILAVKYGNKPFIKRQSLYRSIVVFFVWLSVTFLLSSVRYNVNQNIVAAMYLLRLGGYYLFLLYGLYHITQTQLRLFPIIVISALGVLLPCIVQYFLYQDLGNLAYLGWDPHQYRLVGLFFDPPITVSILALFFIFLISVYGYKKSKLYLVLAAVTLLMIALTYSRGGYLALLATGCIFFIRKFHLKYAAIAVSIIILLIFFVPKGTNESINLLRTTSIFTRFADYEVGWSIFTQHPIFGIGYNHIRYEKDTFVTVPKDELFNPSHSAASLHSSYLMVLVTSGLVGLLLYGYMLLEVSKLHSFAVYSSIFLGVISLFDNVFLHPFILYYFFFLTMYATVIRPSDSGSLDA